MIKWNNYVKKKCFIIAILSFKSYPYKWKRENYEIRGIGYWKSAVILSVGGEGALRQHFLDMGLIQGTEVTMVKYAPMGDPMEIKIHD